MTDSLQKLLQRRAIALFIERCPSLCSILKRAQTDFEIVEGDRILAIDVATQEDGSILWAEGEMLAAAAERFNSSLDGEKVIFIKEIYIKYLGELYGPPITVQTVVHMQQPIMYLNSSDGDLLRRIADCGVSAGLVDVESNRLIAVSQQIVATAGRDWFFMLTQGQDMNSMWPPASLHELSQALRQNGRLKDYLYQAYTWVQKGGVWQRQECQFRAKSFELVNFRDRLFRLSMGVEIV